MRRQRSKRPVVDVISLGGTISATGSGETGVSPLLTGAALVSAIPRLDSIAEVVAVDEWTSLFPGPHLTLDHIMALARLIHRRLDGSADGVVVTQGTDTIEETAFALDLLVDRSLVVVTGAMRDPTLDGADGPANLLAAVSVAADERARRLGAVVVVMNDEIHAARHVRKSHTTNPAAFTSPTAGRLGQVVEGRVRIDMTPAVDPRPRLTDLGAPPPVALLRAALGDDARLVDQVSDSGYEGLVFEAFGGGHVSPVVADRLERAAARYPVVVASRVGAGSMLRSTYGFPGSERDLLARGLIFAGTLDGPKARVLLSLLLAAGRSGDQLARAFRAWHGDAPERPGRRPP